MKFEFKKLFNNTYYFVDSTRIGLYRLNEKDVVLFDAGKNTNAAIKIEKVLLENNWKLKAIYLTHSHADHMGGAQYLKEKTKCTVFAPKIERELTTATFLEPGFMYGGFPPKELCMPFLCSIPCETTLLKKENLFEGIEMIELKGHTFNMFGYKTPDNIWFLADSYVGEEVLNKHPISFVYDVNEYLITLNKLKKLEGKMFIASHAKPLENIDKIINKNMNNVLEVIETINNALDTKDYCFDQLLAHLFTHFDLVMNFVQHYLVGCSIKSYLVYLREKGLIDTKVINNQLKWYRIKE